MSEDLNQIYCGRSLDMNPKYKEMARSDKDFEKLWEDRDFKDIITANQV